MAGSKTKGASGQKQASSSEPTARERILAAASRLFYRDGIRAVGVDALIAEAGVATMTFYRQFPSKEALVEAYLKEQDQLMRKRWDAYLHDVNTPARDRLRDFFAGTAERMAHPKFRGCPMINAANEFPAAHAGVRTLVAGNKAAMRECLVSLATEAGAADPAALADHLALLIDGAMASSQTLGAQGPAAALVKSADIVLRAHLRTLDL
jgi:AcrR family transcriptional regulator